MTETPHQQSKGHPMKLVILESPYGSDDDAVVAENVRYARACMHDCLVNHDEYPYASHLLYTQPGVLKDRDREERKLGIAAGLAWGAMAQATAVYTDRGITDGMKQGIERALEEGRTVHYRELVGWVNAPPRLTMEFTGYVGAIAGREEVHIDCGDLGMMTVIAPGCNLWPIYCHNVRVTIEDQGEKDGK